MISNIEEPLALATVTWASAEEGGRRSGPPTALVYSATAVLALGNDADVEPGWPAAANQICVLLQCVSRPAMTKETVKV
jgi:hypothetical protein